MTEDTASQTGTGLIARLFAGSFHGLRRGGRAALDLLLPPVCLACRQPVSDPHGLCAACWSGLRFIERPYCERLGIPFAYDLGPGALSAEAIATPPPYDRCRSAVLYEGPALDLVRGLKYRDRTDLARLIGRLAARAARDLVDGADLVMPVPLHWRRLLKRRFNQSAMVARMVSVETGIPLDVASLKRIRSTRPQVGLTGRARSANVAGAFRVSPEAARRIAGRNVILVDDVITTGATAAAATRTLKRAGAARVDLLTFARVPTKEAADGLVGVEGFEKDGE
jgi:ComF family protein